MKVFKQTLQKKISTLHYRRIIYINKDFHTNANSEIVVN